MPFYSRNLKQPNNPRGQAMDGTLKNFKFPVNGNVPEILRRVVLELYLVTILKSKFSQFRISICIALYRNNVV